MANKHPVGFYKKDGKTRPITASSGRRRSHSAKPTTLSCNRASYYQIRHDQDLGYWVIDPYCNHKVFETNDRKKAEEYLKIHTLWLQQKIALGDAARLVYELKNKR